MAMDFEDPEKKNRYDDSTAYMAEDKPFIRRVVIIGAGVGAGHNQAGLELRSRLENAGVKADFYDILDGLPWLTKTLALVSYWIFANYRCLGWLWDYFIGEFDSTSSRGYQMIFQPSADQGRIPIREWTRNADAVIATHAVPTQILGQLKADGELKGVPVASYLCDAGVLGCLLHPAMNAHFVPSAATQKRCKSYGYEATTVGPLVGQKYLQPVKLSRRAQLRRELGLSKTGDIILVTGGSQGIGQVYQTVFDISKERPTTPIIVLCGTNTQLQERLRRSIRKVIALGWRDDIHEILAISTVMIHNAGGMAVWEAITTGLPTITYRELPGHGRRNAQVLADSGLSPWPCTKQQLNSTITEVLWDKRAKMDESNAPRRLGAHDITEQVLRMLPQQEQ